MKKLKYIDALRGIAVLAVLFVHCSQFGTRIKFEWFTNIADSAAKGVQLFFVASAFTLFLSMNNRTKKEENATFNFFIRRFFRIAPLYYIAIIYYLYQDGRGPRFALGDAPYVTNWNIISNFLFIHGFNPYWINVIVPGGWSITVEMLFYCLVPLLFLKIKSLNAAVNFFTGALIFNLILSYGLTHAHLTSHKRLLNDYLYYFLPSQLPVFACGIIMFFLITTKKTEWKIQPNSMLFLALLFLFYLSTGMRLLFADHILFAIGFVVAGIALSKKEFLLIVNPVTTYIGKISYSMYIVHFAILHYMQQLKLTDLIEAKNENLNLLGFGLQFFVLAVLTVIVSTITYHLIEIPFQKLGKWIINKNKSVYLSTPVT